MLKLLEDPPDTCFFFLCTTEPKKLIETVRGRCSIFTLNPINGADLRTLAKREAETEKIKLTDEVLEKLVTAADGSARKVLVDLERISHLKTAEEQLNAIVPADAERAAFDLVKALIPWTGKPKWDDIAKILREIESEEAEGLRHMILASARSSLLSPKSNEGLRQRAFVVIDAFAQPFYEPGKSGHAKLAAACYEAAVLGVK